VSTTLFTNVRILDGAGALPYAGSVLVEGNRIRTVSRSSAALAPTGATVIDGAGATLMPGMCEAHTHFSWNDAATLGAIQTMPLEEHVLWCRKVAKRYLLAGFTSCVGAACAKPRLDVVIRNAINSGQIPGRATSRRARRSLSPVRSATRRCRTCRFRSSASASTSTRPTR
jgi:imidazolonepropionase-like amidohydrolase